MVVCKFFLQGTCKFGSNCKFDHQIESTSSAFGGSSILRQNVTTSAPLTADLVHSVQRDMENTEKGGQWLLSSYAPFKEKPAFPGFEDRSFEEIRLGHYDAVKNGSVEQYEQSQDSQTVLQQLCTENRMAQSLVPTLYSIINDMQFIARNIKSANTGDEYDAFGKHVAKQLRKLSPEEAIIAQEGIQALITKSRFNDLKKLNPSHINGDSGKLIMDPRLLHSL